MIAGESLSVLAAAELLGIHQRTIYALIEEGELEAEVTRPGGSKGRRVIRIRPAAVEAYLERVRVQPGELIDLYPPSAGGRYRSGLRLVSYDPEP